MGDIVAWLRWNDPNGRYWTEDDAAEAFARDRRDYLRRYPDADADEISDNVGSKESYIEKFENDADVIGDKDQAWDTIASVLED